MEYLNKMALETNPSSFIKLIEFISLFREYVNNQINIKNENPENLSCYSNNFINKFITKYDFGFSKQESIKLFKNFCFWLNDSHYSKFKILHLHK